MRKRVAWPGVAVKTAKGRTYHYWNRTTPWVRLPDPVAQPDAFMRKLASLQRVDLREGASRSGTLADTARLYRKSRDFTDRADSTRELYSAYLDRLCEIFPGAALEEITPELVQRYVMDEHADTRGAANMMLRVLHIIYKWAGKRQKNVTDPTKGIELYEATPIPPWPEHVLEAALSSPDLRLRAAVALHLFTGQRTGDACRMTWNAITPDGHIPVRQQKTKTELVIPMHPRLRQVLADAPRTAVTILTNNKDGALQPSAFAGWVDAFGKRCGVKLQPHGLRKNAVISLLESECSIAEVSSITGQSLAIVEHYAKARNQGRIATAAMLKWGSAHSANGKTSAGEENRGSK